MVSCFKNGRVSLENDSRAGRLMTSRSDENVTVYSHLLIEERTSKTVHIIMHLDLSVRDVCTKFVTHLLTL